MLALSGVQLAIKLARSRDKGLPWMKATGMVWLVSCVVIEVLSLPA
jgi:hypothetical protein